MFNPFHRIAEWWAREKGLAAESDRWLEQKKLRWETEIKPLPIEAAKHRVGPLLADPAKFECVIAPPENDAELERLAPHLREFFERYESG